jgi:hypothetical protein
MYTIAAQKSNQMPARINKIKESDDFAIIDKAGLPNNKVIKEDKIAIKINVNIPLNKLVRNSLLI